MYYIVHGGGITVVEREALSQTLNEKGLRKFIIPSMLPLKGIKDEECIVIEGEAVVPRAITEWVVDTGVSSPRETLPESPTEEGWERGLDGRLRHVITSDDRKEMDRIKALGEGEGVIPWTVRRA